MRYKAQSPFVRTPARDDKPQDPDPGSTTRIGLLLALSAVLVLSPIAFQYSDSTIFAPIAAEAEAGGGRKTENLNGRGNKPSAPPGQEKKPAAPSPTPVGDAPEATPVPTPTPVVTPTPRPTATPPQPTTVATPTPPQATPAPTPPATTVSGSCATGPGSAPSGWRRVMADSFSEDIPLGEWGKPGGRWEFPGGMWRARTAGYRDSSGRGTYNSPKTTSQHDGKLDVWIHSEGSTRYVAAPIPLVGNTVGQRVSLCMRADQIPGYKIAFLLWPDEGPGNYHGEIDFPEGKLLSTGSAHAFMHYDPKPSSGKQQDAYDSNVNLMSWHTYTMEWHPNRHYASFYLDGRLIGRSEKSEVPDGPMHYVMQMETYLAGQDLPPPAQGHVLVDWFTIDVPS